MGRNKPATQAAYYRRWRVENRDAYLKGKRSWYERNREREIHRRWTATLRREYGLTEADYEAMLEAQPGLCAICREPERAASNERIKRLCVDHDHDTGRVRGLLCHACNAAIGLIRGDAGTLRRAAEYLEAA